MGWSWEGALAGFADPSYGAKLMLERQKAEAEAAQRAAALQSFGIGGSPLQSMGGQQVAPQAMTPDDSYLQRLGGLYAQTGDSRILEQMAEYTSPGAELDRRMKEAQIANMQGENALNTTRFNNEQMDYLDRIDKQRREAQVFGTGQPDFGPSYQPPPRQGNAALPVANPNATNESLGLPNPSQIAQQAQAMLNGQQPQQAAPTSPAPAQQAQPAPQNATTATALMSYEDFVANDPRGQAAFRVDANKRDIGLTESMKAYNEYAQNQQKQTQETAPVDAAKQDFSGALNEIKAIYDDMRRNGTIPSASQNVVARSATAATQGLEDPERKQTVDGLLARLRLSLMSATGMSAQVFNSNTEMQALMKALSSPTSTYEANINILNSLNKQYGNGQELKPLQTEQQSRPTRLRWNAQTGRVE